MRGSVVTAAGVLGACVLVAALALAAVVWFAVHTAIGRVESTLQQMTAELATPIQEMFNQPVRVATVEPIVIGHPVALEALRLDETLSVRLDDEVPVTLAPLSLTIEEPLTVRGTWEDGVLPVTTEIPLPGP